MIFIAGKINTVIISDFAPFLALSSEISYLLNCRSIFKEKNIVIVKLIIVLSSIMRVVM